MRVERKERDLSKVVIKRIYHHRGCVVSKRTYLLGDRNIFWYEGLCLFSLGAPCLSTHCYKFSVLLLLNSRDINLQEKALALLRNDVLGSVQLFLRIP